MPSQHTWMALLALVLLLGASSSGSQQLSGTAFRFGTMEKGPVNLAGPPYSVEANSCGYGPMPLGAWPWEFVAGISSQSPVADNSSMKGCGVCLHVKCVNTTTSLCKGGPQAEPGIIVQVVDTCATCKNTSLNLYAGAFARLAASPSQSGQLEVEYERVPCNPPGNVTVRVSMLRRDAGAYIKLALKSVAGNGNVVAVDLARAGMQDAPLLRGRGGGGAIWRDMDNSQGAEWEYSGLPVSQPGMDLRVTSDDGQVLNIRNAIPADAIPGDYPTGAQFKVTAA